VIEHDVMMRGHCSDDLRDAFVDGVWFVDLARSASGSSGQR
jgi:hypothetical protein